MDQGEPIGHFGGVNFGLKLRRPYLYAGFGPELAVIDVADPAKPVRVGSLLLDGLIQDIDLAGPWAFVYTHDAADRLVVYYVDITRAASPRLVGTVPVALSAIQLAEDGRHAYLAAKEAGLVVTDLGAADPFAPVATYLGAGTVWSIALSGSRAYLTADEFQVLDISDVSNPVLVGRCILPNEGGRMAVDEQTVFVNLGEQVLAIDVSRPESPHVFSQYGSYDTHGFIQDLALHQRALCLISEGEGDEGLLDLVDLADPARLRSIGQIRRPGIRVAADEGLIAASFWTGGLRLFDAALTPLGQWIVPLWASSLIVRETQGIIAGMTALIVLNVTDPAAIQGIGVYADEEMRTIHGLDVAGDVAFLAEGPSAADAIAHDGLGGGLRVVDLSAPEQPVGLAFVRLPDNGVAQDLVCAGGTLYLLWYAFDYKIHRRLYHVLVFDVTDPAYPTQTGDHPVPEGATVLEVDGLTLLVDERAIRLAGPARLDLKLQGEGMSGIGPKVVAGRYRGVVYELGEDQGLTVYRAT